LFSAIGTTYGAGDGSTTFNLPDLRGEFIRGWDDARGVDAGRTLGSAQAQNYQSHNHGITDPGHSHVLDYLVPLYGGDTDRGEGSSVFSVDNSAQPSVVANSTGITINNSGGAETRPRNVALLGCVKT
jgi:phage-related tail fiber protein